ncbi:MAG: YesL family protein [Lachnospiraceae bacterium]|nr:YesL family protein [Lachnospiraceae bacterium]
MEKLFHEDNIIIIFLGNIFNLMLLNVLTLLCCLPVITIGASLTAMHHVLITGIEEKNGNVIRPFFRAFRENFMQSTILWMTLLGILSVMGSLSFLCFGKAELMYQAVCVGAILIMLLSLMVFLYILPLQARYRNTIRQTVQNAAAIALSHIPQSFAMLAILIVCGKLYTSFGVNVLAFIFLFGLTIPGWLFMKLYVPVLHSLQEKES